MMQGADLMSTASKQTTDLELNSKYGYGLLPLVNRCRPIRMSNVYYASASWRKCWPAGHDVTWWTSNIDHQRKQRRYPGETDSASHLDCG